MLQYILTQILNEVGRCWVVVYVPGRPDDGVLSRYHLVSQRQCMDVFLNDTAFAAMELKDRHDALRRRVQDWMQH